MQLTDEQVKESFPHGQFVNLGECPEVVLDELDTLLGNMVRWGINPKGVSTGEFDSALIQINRTFNGQALPVQLHVTLRHKTTNKQQPYLARYIRSLSTGVDVVALATPNA